MFPQPALPAPHGQRGSPYPDPGSRGISPPCGEFDLVRVSGTRPEGLAALGQHKHLSLLFCCCPLDPTCLLHRLKRPADGRMSLTHSRFPSSKPQISMEWLQGARRGHRRCKDFDRLVVGGDQHSHPDPVRCGPGQELRRRCSTPAIPGRHCDNDSPAHIKHQGHRRGDPAALAKTSNAQARRQVGRWPTQPDKSQSG